MKRTNELLMFLLIAVASVITITVLVQQPGDRAVFLAAFGFSLFTFGWTGMFFRLKRELPDHALLEASYFSIGAAWGGRREGFRNMVDLVQLHFQRHRADMWSMLLIAGVAMLAASLLGWVG